MRISNDFDPSRKQNFSGHSRDSKGRYPDFDLRMMQDESAVMIVYFANETMYVSDAKARRRLMTVTDVNERIESGLYPMEGERRSTKRW
jgi:hypothetical protein